MHCTYHNGCVSERATCLQVPAPFTVEESAELIAVSFMNNMLNRVTIAQLTENETLPMMGVFRPLIQIFPSFQAVIYKSLYKPVSKEAALPGLSAEVRPQTRHSPGSSFKWAAPLPHIADALSYLEGVVNYHLRGRFLPLDLWYVAVCCVLLDVLLGCLCSEYSSECMRLFATLFLSNSVENAHLQRYTLLDWLTTEFSSPQCCVRAPIDCNGLISCV